MPRALGQSSQAGFDIASGGRRFERRRDEGRTAGSGRLGRLGASIGAADRREECRRRRGSGLNECERAQTMRIVDGALRSGENGSSRRHSRASTLSASAATSAHNAARRQTEPVRAHERAIIALAAPGSLVFRAVHVRSHLLVLQRIGPCRERSLNRRLVDRNRRSRRRWIRPGSGKRAELTSAFDLSPARPHRPVRSSRGACPPLRATADRAAVPRTAALGRRARLGAAGTRSGASALRDGLCAAAGRRTRYRSIVVHAASMQNLLELTGSANGTRTSAIKQEFWRRFRSADGGPSASMPPSSRLPKVLTMAESARLEAAILIWDG